MGILSNARIERLRKNGTIIKEIENPTLEEQIAALEWYKKYRGDLGEDSEFFDSRVRYYARFGKMPFSDSDNFNLDWLDVYKFNLNLQNMGMLLKNRGVSGEVHMYEDKGKIYVVAGNKGYIYYKDHLVIKNIKYEDVDKEKKVATHFIKWTIRNIENILPWGIKSIKFSINGDKYTPVEITGGVISLSKVEEGSVDVVLW